MINMKTMMTAIESELNAKGHTSRLLPRNVAKKLWNNYLKQGFVVNSENKLTSNNSEINFQNAAKFIKINFTSKQANLF